MKTGRLDLTIVTIGMHGAPYISWNGVEAAPGASLSGYCSHSSVLFPTWHRPYLALYEVSLRIFNEFVY